MMQLAVTRCCNDIHCYYNYEEEFQEMEIGSLECS